MRFHGGVAARRRPLTPAVMLLTVTVDMVKAAR